MRCSMGNSRLEAFIFHIVIFNGTQEDYTFVLISTHLSVYRCAKNLFLLILHSN